MNATTSFSIEILNQLDMRKWLDENFAQEYFHQKYIICVKIEDQVMSDFK